MSIANEITRIKNNIQNAFNKAIEKGATPPTTQNSDNLASCIESITGGSGGGTVEKGLVINSWDSEGFATDVSIVGMVEIPNYYFYYAIYYISDDYKSWLSNVGSNLHFPDNLTRIGENAFYYCTGLGSLNLPSSLTTIGEYAFYGCSKLALTSLPSSLTTIGEYAFYGCSNLALTSLPNGVTRLESYTFQNCSKLALTSLPSNLTTIGKSVFYSCTKLALTSLPNTLTKIDLSAFYKCTSLTNIEIPCNCTIYGAGTSNGSFRGCTGLKTVTLGAPGVPYTQTNAGKYAFYSCSNIEKIIIYTSTGTGTADYFYKTSTSTYHTIEFRQA